MRKTPLICYFAFLLLLVGCSSNENALEQAPPHIKETWEFFESMSKTTDALDNGEHVEIAFDKHFSNDNEIYSFVESASPETDEEELVYDYIYLMYLELSTLGIDNYNESLGGDKVDVEQYVYDLQVPRYELEEIYKKYGLVYGE